MSHKSVAKICEKANKTALTKGQSQKNRVLYVVCALRAHTTYTPSFLLKRLFSAESIIGYEMTTEFKNIALGEIIRLDHEYALEDC